MHLEIGDPDFPTPDVITARRRAGDGGGRHRLHAVARPARPARRDLRAPPARRTASALDPADIVVTQGTSPAMLLLFGALLDPGDEVIMPDPCYPAYPNYVELPRRRARPAHACAPRTASATTPTRCARPSRRARKAIMLNSPSNPTGAVYTPDALRALAAIAEETGVWIASDEIYHGLNFSGERDHTIREYTDRCFVLNGFSKVYAMTGWRLGYLIAPRAFVRPAEEIQQNFFLCANHFVQAAGTVALTQAQAGRRAHARRLRRAPPLPRARAARARPRRSRASRTGAFYVFADARRWGERLAGALRAGCSRRRASPSRPASTSAPGGEGFLRFSYATSLERLREGVARLRAWAARRDAATHEHRGHGRRCIEPTGGAMMVS